MSFFSALFLPLVLIAAVLHRLLPARFRWVFLLAISLGFYATQGVVPLAVLVGLLVLNVASVALGLARRCIGVGALVALDLAALFAFKYVPWLARDVFGAAATSPLAQIALPLGMSFYTFQLIAYVVDSHRAGRPLLRPWNAASFVAFFPQLAAGPILRAGRDGPQFHAPVVDVSAWPAGLTRVLWGLFKKRVVADALSPLIQSGFSHPETLSCPGAIGVILAYTIQLYLDFSAYADMAIGLAQLFGIALPENFDRPYLARSLREFWQRWHMTLTSWLRDYLYIPLGGNRRRPLRAGVNVLVTMALGGLWHGANWTFLVWGIWHGVWLLVERGVEKVTKGRMPRPLGTAGMLLVVALGWVFFRANSVGEAWRVLAGVTRFSAIASRDLVSLAAVLGLFASLLLVESFRLRERVLRLHPVILGLLAGALAAGVYFASATGTEFIYWRF